MAIKKDKIYRRSRARWINTSTLLIRSTKIGSYQGSRVRAIVVRVSDTYISCLSCLNETWPLVAEAGAGAKDLANPGSRLHRQWSLGEIHSVVWTLYSREDSGSTSPSPTSHVYRSSVHYFTFPTGHGRGWLEKRISHFSAACGCHPGVLTLHFATRLGSRSNDGPS
jgi:hypothetical protein